ncbi:hypothetical protein Q8A67_023171 [Cirrhinus molitorella]|uniref:Uncharacterized protein n=1 Tax=Cirrhinus molitorella TaxID=172907 RepID=A0AA88P197_9TELE|nr:hypothetical protein Q8A67_023171 [Cirrhinus molitorella]
MKLFTQESLISKSMLEKAAHALVWDIATVRLQDPAVSDLRRSGENKHGFEGGVRRTGSWTRPAHLTERDTATDRINSRINVVPSGSLPRILPFSPAKGLSVRAWLNHRSRHPRLSLVVGTALSHSAHCFSRPDRFIINPPHRNLKKDQRKVKRRRCEGRPDRALRSTRDEMTALLLGETSGFRSNGDPSLHCRLLSDKNGSRMSLISIWLPVYTLKSLSGDCRNSILRSVRHY